MRKTINFIGFVIILLACTIGIVTAIIEKNGNALCAWIIVSAYLINQGLLTFSNKKHDTAKPEKA